MRNSRKFSQFFTEDSRLFPLFTSLFLVFSLILECLHYHHSSDKGNMVMTAVLNPLDHGIWSLARYPFAGGPQVSAYLFVGQWCIPRRSGHCAVDDLAKCTLVSLVPIA